MGIEVGLHPKERNVRLRCALQGDTTGGEVVPNDDFWHDGVLFTAGELVRSDFSMILGDVEFHHFPRQERRDRNEFHYFVGLRAFECRTVVESGSARVGERTNGAYPRFGMGLTNRIWEGLVLFGNGGVGLWYWEGSHGDQFYSYDVDAAAGVGWVARTGPNKFEIFLGYRYVKLRTERAHHGKLEALSLNRMG